MTVADGYGSVEVAAHDLLMSTRTELLALDRTPFVRSARRHVLPVMRDVVRRGVDVRTVYAADALRVSGYQECMAELARLGEQARLVAHLPMRVVIADRRTAMLPLESDGPSVRAALVVRGGALVGDLVQVFEEVWERAGARPDLDVSENEVRLLHLLADGLTEAAIGRQVGTSVRTVGRRLTALQAKLGTRDRFALGAEAVRRGLI